MAWTDIFLVPFKVALNQTKNALFIKKEDEQYQKAVAIRKEIRSFIFERIYESLTVDEIYLAIFGEEYISLVSDEGYVSPRDHIKILDEFMEEPNVDLVDKIMIDILKQHFEFYE